MPTYKLFYFPARGFAELSRLCFAAAGVEFEDVRYTREEWPNYKAGMPLQQMPCLEVDGKRYAGSNAIARHLAREFGLYGKSNLDALRIDEIFEAFVDLIQQSFVKVSQAPDEEKPKAMQVVRDEAFPKYAAFLEQRLCEHNNGAGYFVGNELSLGDLILYGGLFSLTAFMNKGRAAGDQEDFVAKFPKLKAHQERIAALPRIAEWVKKRPVTEN